MIGMGFTGRNAGLDILPRSRQYRHLFQEQTLTDWSQTLVNVRASGRADGYVKRCWP
jgi:hypothetical protein